jgi:hypothetical protein
VNTIDQYLKRRIHEAFQSWQYWKAQAAWWRKFKGYAGSRVECDCLRCAARNLEYAKDWLQRLREKQQQ